MEKNAEKVQKIDNGIEAQKHVFEKGSEYWQQISKYGSEHALLTAKEKSIIGIACKIPNKIPSEKQSEIIMNIEQRVISEGFFSQ